MVLNRIKPLLAVSFGLIFLFNTMSSFAAEKTEAKQEGSFNVTETILEHIKDDHSWHLWGHTTIALPVILYTPQGLEVFSSSKLVFNLLANPSVIEIIPISAFPCMDTSCIKSFFTSGNLSNNSS